MVSGSKSAYKSINLNFYRDTNQKEIDLVLETDGRLYAVAIKRAALWREKLSRPFPFLIFYSKVHLEIT